MTEDDATTPIGLLRCLRMLADEASTLQLTRTLAVLQQAMETCRTEAVSRNRFHSSSVH